MEEINTKFTKLKNNEKLSYFLLFAAGIFFTFALYEYFWFVYHSPHSVFSPNTNIQLNYTLIIIYLSTGFLLFLSFLFLATKNKLLKSTCSFLNTDFFSFLIVFCFFIYCAFSFLSGSYLDLYRDFFLYSLAVLSIFLRPIFFALFLKNKSLKLFVLNLIYFIFLWLCLLAFFIYIFLTQSINHI